MDRNSWWVIKEGVLLDSLIRVAQGDHPHVVMAELLANSETEENHGP